MKKMRGKLENNLSLKKVWKKVRKLFFSKLEKIEKNGEKVC